MARRRNIQGQSRREFLVRSSLLAAAAASALPISRSGHETPPTGR